MTISAATLRHHIAYNNWANSRILASAETLSPDELIRDFATADKSAQGTLTHLYRAERSWFERILHGTPKTANRLPEDEVFTNLLAGWARLQEQWEGWAAGLTDEDTNKILNYADMKGNPWSNSLEHVVLHVVNHSTHHRGQVAGFLRAMGKTPPPLDFIAFVRGLK